jgi:hypothetical protein
MVPQTQGENSMSKQEHKYAQVLRWIADGEAVQVQLSNGSWANEDSSDLLIAVADGNAYHADRYRLAPRTVTVNGVECVAPEKVAPGIGVRFYVPYPTLKKWCADSYWEIEEWQSDLLTRGLVFLQEDHAIAYAKAMCNYKEGEK